MQHDIESLWLVALLINDITRLIVLKLGEFGCSLDFVGGNLGRHGCVRQQVDRLLIVRPDAAILPLALLRLEFLNTKNSTILYLLQF